MALFHCFYEQLYDYETAEKKMKYMSEPNE